ncbi:RNA polymerase sigma-70 factor, ECF subfamily [Dyadobacter koreensis]|uniref:RNA polymerase sigma-70 factor, ECF subfamily n=1 Tax=Dyadobacter koreensis TaxID=408657 RepID=A0A1H7ANS9_9BACT|nr:RNA polymerase sigma factor [Dyadobacter koreensis]SEJ67229.1 RNA polymerase sigma-70 factor, ECF subfamily [Dyadobacter koreensis]
MEKEFIDLLNQHRGIVYKICRMYCQDSDDRQDLFQEIVLQLWKAYPTFKRESNVSTWMYRIGMNTAISNYRKEKRKQSPTAFSNMLSEIPDPADTHDIPPETATLYKAIDQLSTVEKAIVLLYLEDKSYEEISGILGIGKSNVGVKISRIKGKLEKILKSFTY